MSQDKKTQNGFTLIELIVSMSLLLALVVGVTQVTRGIFDLKFGLGDRNRVSQTANLVFAKISDDLAHAFIVSSKDILRTGGSQRTMFKVQKSFGKDTLSFTTFNHKPNANQLNEGDATYIVYTLKKDDKTQVSNLYRSETPRIPQDFKEEAKSFVFATNVISFNVDTWTGDGWSQSNWDSTQSDTENLLPRMVRVTIDFGTDPQGTDTDKTTTAEHYATIVYIPYALSFSELKTPVSSFNIP